MAIIGETQFLERIQFFNGERLFATDLQTLEAFNREMRWLHNQSLHQPGVGSGYAVAGNVGDRQVTVSPGYALDSLGREIILHGDSVRRFPRWLTMARAGLSSTCSLSPIPTTAISNRRRRGPESVFSPA